MNFNGRRHKHFDIFFRNCTKIYGKVKGLEDCSLGKKSWRAFFGASSHGILVRTQDSNYVNGGGFRGSVSKLWRLKVRVLGKLGLGISAPSPIWRQLGPHTVCAVANRAPGTEYLALANRARRTGHTGTKYQYQITKYLKHGFISSWRN